MKTMEELYNDNILAFIEGAGGGNGATGIFQYFDLIMKGNTFLNLTKASHAAQLWCIIYTKHLFLYPQTDKNELKEYILKLIHNNNLKKHPMHTFMVFELENLCNVYNLPID